MDGSQNLSAALFLGFGLGFMAAQAFVVVINSLLGLGVTGGGTEVSWAARVGITLELQTLE